MDRISPETKAIYDLLRADFDKANGDRADSTAQAIAQIDAKLDRLSGRIDEVKLSIGVDIDELRQGLDRSAANSSEPSRGAPATPARAPSSSPTCPDGHDVDIENRGSGHRIYVPPPVRGTQHDQLISRPPLSSIENFRQNASDVFGLGPRIELPRFDGGNPKLWQTRCEDYFRFWGTPPGQWISLATALFEGTAARWLESVRRRVPNISWDEFCRLLQSRFGRNLHQTILRKFFNIQQTGTVEDYVDRFSELFDQLSAYEGSPNTVHYVTRFMEGLKPSVRLAVGIQQPVDLDSAYQLALLHEELGSGSTPSIVATPFQRRSSAPPLPPPPVSSGNQSAKRPSDEHRPPVASSSADKWGALRSYRRSKGLCFTCGEKWGKDHVCRQEVQLHIVQEMIEFMQNSEDSETDSYSTQHEVHMLAISAAALGGKDDVSVRTMQLKVQLQGLNLTVLVDSGSTHSFLDTSLASKLLSPLQRVSVKMANGATVSCHQQLLSGMWSCSGHKFSCDFKLFPLGSYDGIIGLDWLSAHSPMLVDWENHWLSFSHMGSEITLLGSAATLPQIAMLHFCSLLTTENLPILPEVQSVLDQFKEVFEPPTGLPPRRAYDHTIPLIPGATPVALRPYRIAPALKTELERQIQDMLASGVIRPSNSPFSSPLLMVKKKDESWRPVIDYRHLNAITVKGKFPIPVIDELLDELEGAGWFTKLDLRSGYHQIRLAPREEYKTAFQTHLGHYEFLVVSFGLTGGPNTFQFAMNHTLAPGNRKYVIVFFDDILVFSITFKEHLQHLRLVLSMLAKHQWKVKLSKCAFAQRQVGYLGHIISSTGVSTDPTKITAIDTWPTPANVKEVCGFLGLAGYYRKFIRHYGIICRSLTNLLKKGTMFRWSDIEDSAFRTLKQALVTAPVLALPDFNKTFVIATDACDVGICAVLMQDDHPLAYVSKALGPRNRALSVYEKEFLAILLAVEHWR